MDIDQYKKTMNGYRNCNEHNLFELMKWADVEALPWLWTELAGIVGKKKIKPLSPPNAIRQGLQTTLVDREKVPLTKNFYVAQMTMLDTEAKRYCNIVGEFKKAVKKFAADATIYNLHSGLRDLLDDGIILLEQAGYCLLNLPGAYGAWSRRVESPFEVFKGAEQVIYGQFSGLTHIDRAPFTPVSLLRTAIEIRIRSAFGIYAYLDPTNQSIQPIDLNRLFKEIKPHLPRMQFNVDFHDIIKVYRWTNPHLHAGWRDFVWVPGYALQFLRSVFADSNVTPTGGWSIDGGIRMPREVWRAIRNTFEIAGKAEGLQLNLAQEQTAACVFLN